MGIKIKYITQIPQKGERGYVYILVLCFLVIGALMIPVLLGYMGTGLKSGQVFERKADELYATDAGVDDAIWKIKYGKVSELSDPTPYDPYDYTTEWPYELADELNDQTVSVTISNNWVPAISPIPTPSKAQEIIDARKLLINGTKTGTSDYRIRISFVPADEEERNNMHVTSIGIWLPSGYQYQPESSNLEEDIFAVYHSVPDSQQYGGGEVIIWDFSPSVQFSEFPPAGSTETAIVEFEYTTDSAVEERKLETISWITTTGAVPNADFAWDTDTRVYSIKSTASDTTVDSVVYLSSRYSGFLDNAITSLGDVTLYPDTFVHGNVQYNGELYNKGEIDGEEITDEIDWPNTEEWLQFYLSQVTSPPPPPMPAPDPGPAIDLIDYPVGVPIGPFYRNGNLSIDNTGEPTTAQLKNGEVIYVTGDLSFEQPGAAKEYWIDMNWATIFVEGSIDFPPGHVGLKGSGCIIAIGDINFQPQMEHTEDNYILVCSLEGFTLFHPQGDFYGSIAGLAYCDLHPTGSLWWTPAPGGLNLPGSVSPGPGTGGSFHNVTKYIWKIE
jgi:hypothetical protein